jgi:hypothetical protein
VAAVQGVVPGVVIGTRVLFRPGSFTTTACLGVDSNRRVVSRLRLLHQLSRRSAHTFFAQQLIEPGSVLFAETRHGVGAIIDPLISAIPVAVIDQRL